MKLNAGLKIRNFSEIQTNGKPRKSFLIPIRSFIILVSATALYQILYCSNSNAQDQAQTRAEATDQVHIPGGAYQPFFPNSKYTKERRTVKISSFSLDPAPVTNGKYLEFVKTHPEFQKSKIPTVLAEKSYLNHWKGDLELQSPEQADEPVRFVSWFAAKSYCESKSHFLPTIEQWEFAAKESGAAMEKSTAEIMDWYAKPGDLSPNKVRQKKPNKYGLYDMHGLIWEWSSDFNSTLISNDSRAGGGDGFCGGASASSRNPNDYAAFMRFAFRSSLKASYAVNNLGFRCAGAGK